MTSRKAVQTSIIVLAVAAAVAITLFTRRDRQPGQYFYDLSEQVLYRAPRTAFAPEAGVGGAEGDGVEAIVVCCPECGAAARRIAYLQTHTPEFKRRHEEARSAGGAVEGLTRDYISANTLVRLVSEERWYATSTADGARIVTGWRQRCPTHHKAEKPVQP